MTIHWHILSDFCLIPKFIFVSIELTITNIFPCFCIDCHGSWINPRTFGAGLSFHFSGVSGSSILLAGSVSDSVFVSQLTSLSLGLSKTQLQSSQVSVTEMLWGVPTSSLSAGCWLILLIRWTVYTWVHPPGRVLEDNTGGTGDLFDNLNAAAPSCWQFDQDPLILCSGSEM